MSEYYEPKKNFTIAYTANGFATGLSDVEVNIYRPDGTLALGPITMDEVATTGIYTTSIKLGKGAYLAKADSVTTPGPDSFTLYVGGKPGDFSTGGGFLNDGERGLGKTKVWTVKEKERLLKIVTDIGEKLKVVEEQKAQLQDMVGIQKDLLDTYGQAVKIGAETKDLVDSGSKESVDGIKKLMDSLSDIKSSITERFTDLKMITEEISSETKTMNQEVDNTTTNFKEAIEGIKERIKELQDYGDVLLSTAPDSAIDLALEEDDEH